MKIEFDKPNHITKSTNLVAYENNTAILVQLEPQALSPDDELSIIAYSDKYHILLNIITIIKTLDQKAR